MTRPLLIMCLAFFAGSVGIVSAQEFDALGNPIAPLPIMTGPSSPESTRPPTQQEIANDPYCVQYCSIRPDDPSCAACNAATRATTSSSEENSGVINVGNPLDPRFGTNITPQPETGDAITAAQTRIGQLLGNMLRGIAALSLLPIVVGGFQMIISQGNDEKVGRGKQTLYFGVVGLVLALLGIAIFQTLLSLLVTSK